MSLKYGILVLLAFCLVLLLALKNYEVWTQPMEIFSEAPKEEIRPMEKKTEPLRPPEGVKETPSIPPHHSMAEKNIFNPDRKEFPVVGGLTKPAVRPQIVLYGVTRLEDYQAASISNPGRPLRKGEREVFTIKLGEKIGDYKLAQISSDRITLEAEGDSFEVLLYDPRVPKKRVDIKTEVKPATVTSIQPTPAGPVPKTAIPSPPQPPAVLSKPSPTIQPALPPQTIVSPPPGTGTPATPPATIRRGRTTFTPPSGTQTQGSGGN